MWPSRPFQLIDLPGRFLRLWALLTFLLPDHHQFPVIFDSAVSCLWKHLLVNISGDFKVYNSASQSVVPGPELLASLANLSEVYTFRLHPTSMNQKLWEDDLEIYILTCPPGVHGLPGWFSGKESAYNAGDLSSIPRSGISSGGGNGNPLQYSCLENPSDRDAGQAVVHGVLKSGTQLSNWAHPYPPGVQMHLRV